LSPVTRFTLPQAFPVLWRALRMSSPRFGIIPDWFVVVVCYDERKGMAGGGGKQCFEGGCCGGKVLFGETGVVVWEWMRSELGMPRVMLPI